MTLAWIVLLFALANANQWPVLFEMHAKHRIFCVGGEFAIGHLIIWSMVFSFQQFTVTITSVFQTLRLISSLLRWVNLQTRY